MNASSLHHAIITGFLDAQRAPTIAELAAKFARNPDDVRRALRALAEDHGVLLHPRSDEVWIAHPFSSSPSTCVVHAGGKRWWGNCAWCALGLAHLAGGSAEIETRLGGIDAAVTIRMRQGAILDTEFVVHFPIPMQQAWDNVVYTCSVMLLFRSRSDVAHWCAERGVPLGDVRPIEQVSAFAAEWYARHADPDWVKWSVPDAKRIFTRHGLSGPIWALPDEHGRF